MFLSSRRKRIVFTVVYAGAPASRPPMSVGDRNPSAPASTASTSASSCPSFRRAIDRTSVASAVVGTVSHHFSPKWPEADARSYDICHRTEEKEIRAQLLHV